MQNDDQLDINFGETLGDGYAAWQWDRQAAVSRVVETWGLPIGQQVRLKRYEIDGEFVGKLELVSLPARIDRRLPLELKIGRMIFSSSEVDACSVVKG